MQIMIQIDLYYMSVCKQGIEELNIEKTDEIERFCNCNHEMIDYLMSKSTCYWTEVQESHTSYMGGTCGDREISKEQIYADFISQLRCNVTTQDSKTEKPIRVHVGYECQRTIPAWAVVSPFFLFLFIVMFCVILSKHSSMSLTQTLTQEMMALGDYGGDDDIQMEDRDLEGFGHNPESGRKDEGGERNEKEEKEETNDPDEYTLGETSIAQQSDDSSIEDRGQYIAQHLEHEFPLEDEDPVALSLGNPSGEIYGAPIPGESYNTQGETEI